MELRIPHVSIEFPARDGDPGFSLYVQPLSLYTGELTFIMGHNGSGKSLFLKFLSGELSADGGLEFHNSKKRPGFVRQQAELSLAPELTVRENLLLRFEEKSWFPSYFYPKGALGKHVNKALSRHPALLRKLDQPCRNLSVGQRQTLAFIAVTVRNSTLLLLDEFLAATDHSTSKILIELVREYACGNPACVLIVSHDINVALREGNRIIVFYQGQIARDLKPSAPGWDAETLSNLLSSSAAF